MTNAQAFLRKYFWSAFVLALLLTISGLRLGAQTTSGTILGNVLDSSGAAVPGAQITITNQDTGVVRTTVSSSDGVYNVPSLLPGKYAVAATAQGFSSAQVKDVVLNVGSDARVDLKLQVGQVTQQVTVTEAVPTVETTSSDVSQVMDQNLIQDVPLNNRDLQQLAEIQPGVQYNNYQAYGKQLSVAGDRNLDNRYLQEGMDMTWTYRTAPGSLPTPDGVMLGVEATKEFKVITTDAGPEYGEESGGVISMLFKSGTNNFHGSAYEYYRTSAFDARNFFDKTSVVPPLTRNQFGSSFGGPIQKDKTFFFVNYEGYRLSSSQTFLADLPDNNARGIGNGSGQLPCSGTTATTAGGCGPAPGTLATGTLVTVPVNAAIYNNFFAGSNPLLPTCTIEVGAGLCAYSSNPVETIQEDYGLVKIDHSFGTKNTLSATYNNDQAHQYEPVQTGANADDQTMRRQTFTIQDTHIVSTNVVNTVHFGINRIYYLFVEDLTGNPSRYLPSLFVNPTSIYTPSPYPQIPVIAVNGGMTSFGNGVSANYAPRWMGYTAGALSDQVDYLHGNHALQFGVESKKWDDDQNIKSQVSRGNYTFQNLAQFLTGGPAQTFAWLDQLVSDEGRGWRMKMIALYANDTFKFKPNLTFTYGLRWEYVPGPSEEHNRIASVYNPTPTSAPYPPLTGGPYFNASKDDFAPRLGFNWDPFKQGKTSVRGGAGIFFNQIEDDNFYSGPYNAPPFATNYTLSNLVTFPFNLTTFNQQVATQTIKQNFGGSLPPDPKTPTKYAYNLFIQQELPDHMTFLVGYVGSQTRHLGRGVSWQDYLPTATILPGQIPMVNGQPITYPVYTGTVQTGTTTAPTNPNCTQAGSIQCLYWAGTGVDNANILGTVAGSTNPSAAYATLCAPSATPAIVKNCYNNNNYGSSISGELFDANSFFNSLQTALERRVSNGLYVRFNYTFNRCITDSTDNLQGGDTIGGSGLWEPTLDHSGKRARCSFEGTHAANLTLTYDSPFGHMVQSKIAKELVSGWQISSLTTVSSGQPFTISDGLNVGRTATSGTGTDRPNWAPGATANGCINKHNVVNYFNASCFTLPPYGYLGDVGALPFTSPALVDTDLSLRRSFPLKREGMAIQVAADMFNAFNRTNLAAPAITTIFTNSGSATAPNPVINPAAGQIQSTVGTSRQFQISGRFTF